MSIYKGQTSHNFEYEIDSECLDDMEMLELLSEMIDNPMYLPKVCEKLLGKEQKKRLYDHYRDESGRVPVSEISTAIDEMFKGIGNTGKNF